MDRIPVAPIAGPAIRLHSWYGSATALLRELSRALDQGQTLLRADSGLPVGTHLVLVMSADCLSKPLEVQGTVTAWSVRGARHEMTLRYDFDPGPQRRQLDEAFAELRRLNYRPRVAPRVPLRLAADGAALAADLEVAVVDASRSGARLRLAGDSLPPVAVGSRLVMRHQGVCPGTRRPLRLILEVRWIGPTRRFGGRRTRAVGGRFVHLSDAMRKRLQALLRFEEARPQLSLLAIDAPRASRATGKTRARRRRGLKR
ncbi:MAG: PilZ domain-containing protein [Acidobacteria bacterium]|jgi:hypothetical protein|nr:PilZ domain-containing protein [Acidobacteriota bacterium]